ncbi:MAG: PEP-CTERM sorting domain-containing protein [Opitutales bacterium]|nr:PEP-CTERM sorting domain-containing protein [Opitutales bacterium]
MSNINILMTGSDNKGTQYLRGDNSNIKTISVRGGKLYINGENLVNTNISFENAVGALGIVSKDTDFGVLNVNKLNLNHRSILLLDISDAQQDIITAKNVSFADPTLNNNKTLHIDFTLGDDIVLGKQYKVFEATEALQENGALEYITSTNNKDYFANFVISGNALNVFFTNVAVPEPAEWAMIFGALALGLAIYRRRK